MAWRIEFTRHAERDIKQMDAQTARRILRFLHERIAPLDDPRAFGRALQTPRFGDCWRYRIGDYRVIAEIRDTELVIEVVRATHRSRVYR